MKNNKNKKKYVIVSQRLYPSQINELSICCFLIKKEKLDGFLQFIVNNGGRVISAVPCSGIARNGIVQTLEGYPINQYFIFSMCQKEITDIFMLNVVKEYNLNKPENGKAFVLDVLGYMGAKGPFVE
jgi:hypothetical protein